MIEMDCKIIMHELLLIQINGTKAKAFTYNRSPTDKLEGIIGIENSHLATFTEVADAAKVIHGRGLTRDRILI